MMAFDTHTVIPGLAQREPGTHGLHALHLAAPWVPDRAPRVRNDGALFLLGAALLALSACASYRPPPPPLPTSGPIAYNCADGTQLMVDIAADSARVAIIGGPSMVLPRAGDGYYSNGRYAIRGGGAAAQWEVGRRAPVSCRGS